MAWIRQLPSGLWAATVRTPAGRITQSHELKSVVSNWAKGLEADVDRQDFIDPRAGEISVGEWWNRCQGTRHLEKASRKRDESHWRNHVEPRWGGVEVGSILKPDVSTWVVAMQGAGVGGWTVEAALKVLRVLMDQAVEAKLRRDNPCLRIKKAPPAAHVDRVLDAEEERALIARLTELHGDRIDGKLFIELLADTGMRWEEAAVLAPELLDTKRQRIAVAWVMERDGTARPYAKSERGNRFVTYGDHLAARMAAAKLAAPSVEGVFPVGRRGQQVPSRLVFFAPGGGGRAKRRVGQAGPLRYSNWHRQVWAPALWVEIATEPAPRPAGRRGPAPKAVRREHYLEDPQPTPHDLRHTFGTRLADAGVPQHEIMALMGHKDQRSVQRYLHAGEERFARAREAMRLARGHAPGVQGHESGVSQTSRTRSTVADAADGPAAGQ